MTTRLIIRTADTSRANWKALHCALRGQGLELHRYHAALLDGGMTIVADAYHPDGGEEPRAYEALAATSASLYVMH
ncbi:hypothetical protein [Caballeronia cordobensis]|uniref:hypothetical protein n=1 Tax=Caballeronia cordobensis TaxID=1353886 RepID=UPI00045F095C|nr:hypothetical protein BRPE67_ACDS09610 [Burkholderia sp. RPE67]